MQKIFPCKFFIFIILLIPIIFVSPVYASIDEATPLDLKSTIPPNTPLLQTYGTITGTVTGGGQPLTTVYVIVYHYDNILDRWIDIAQTNTYPSGQYSVTDLEPGLYRLEFYDWKREYLSEFYNDTDILEMATDITLVAGETINIDVILTEGGKISGTVTGSTGPITSVNVRAYQHNNATNEWEEIPQTTFPNENGNYTLKGLRTGTYRVEFDPYDNDPHLPSYYQNATDLSGATNIDVVVANTVSNIDAVLVEGGRITGTVTDSYGPVSRVDIRAYQYNSATNEWEEIPWTISPDYYDGTYTLQGLQTGTYRIEFDPWGNHFPAYYQNAVDLNSATDINITVGSAVSGIDAFLLYPSCIKGTVYKATGSVHANVRVETYLADNSTTPVAQTYTNSAGRYNFSDLYPGTYRVHFTDLTRQDISLYYDQATTFDSATDIETFSDSCVDKVDAFFPNSTRITDIQRPRFIQPGEAITAKLKFTIPNDLITPPNLGIKIPPGWSVSGNATYTGDNDGTFSYDSDLVLELQNEYGGNWWGGSGTADLWSDAETSVELTLQSSTTTGDYLPIFVIGTSQGWGRLEEAPVRITEQIPVRGVDVTAVRDYESSSIGVSTSLQQAQDMDMEVIYHYLGWDATEVKHEYYHWVILDDILKQARAYNQKVVLRIYNPPAHYEDSVLFYQGLSGTDLQAQDTVEHKIKKFMQRLTQHVKEVELNDVVAGYVIWNEPNIAGEWGAPPNPVAYMNMLKSAYKGAKEGDPATIIISAPLAPTGDTPDEAINDLTYLNQLYDLGLTDYVDYIGMNGLGFQYDPNHNSGSVDYDFMRLKHLHDVMLSKGDDTHKAWVLEVGWLRESEYDMGEFEPYKVTQEQQAQYLCRAFQKAHNEWWDWVDLMTIWNLDFKDYPHNYPPESAFHWYSISDNEPAEECLTNLVFEETGIITGTVTDGTNPIPNINVIVHQYDALLNNWVIVTQSSTDDQGNYTIADLEIGVYRINFDDGNGAYISEFYDDQTLLTDATDIYVYGGQTTPSINAELIRATGNITGTVTGDTNPIPNIDVLVYQYDDTLDFWDIVTQGNTDDQGNYTITDLNPGIYRIEFFDANALYISEYYDDQILLEDATDIYVYGEQTTPNINAELTHYTGGTITGNVTDGTDPIANIDVLVYLYDGVWDDWEIVTQGDTDAQGNYTISDLETGIYRIEFYDWNAIYLSEYYDDQDLFFEATDIYVYNGQTTSGINAELTRSTGGRITGNVTNGTDPIPYIEIFAYRYDSNMDDWTMVGWNHTNAAGDYAIGYLDSGIYRMEFYDSFGYYIGEFYDDKSDIDSATSINVLGGQTTSNINAELAFVDGARVFGTVTDGTNPIPGIQVIIYQYDSTGDEWTEIGETYTNIQGNFTIAGLEAGTYNLQFVDRYNGIYISEFYDDQPDIDNATDINISDSQIVTGINAILGSTQGNSPDGNVYLPVILSQ